MKIAFIMYQGNMFSGGQGIYTYYLTRELARMGHEVHVIAGPPYPQVDDAVTLHNVKTESYWSLYHNRRDFMHERHPLTHFHPVNFYEFASTRIALSSLLLTFSVRAYVKIKELMPETQFDIVHDNQTLSYGILMMKSLGLPTVATIHHPLSVDLRNSILQSHSIYEMARRYLWFPWIMQEVTARRMDRIITVSQNTTRAIERMFHVPRDLMTCVYNGIDTERFRPLPEIPESPNTILFNTNSEDRNKGAVYLFDALRILRDQQVPFHLIIVDNDRKSLKLAPELVRRYGLSTQVTFIGRVSNEELLELYNRATILTSPSLYEGFGLPAAEAMACEKAVIATTAPAFPEVMEHGKTGWLVAPADGPALAEGIRLLLGDEELRRRLGKAARQSIIERFNWRTNAEQVLAVYEEAIAKRRG
ncbi:MAG: glycosyltransferase family 4 protein [Dehalococcoidia bacterium]|jgi:glycosyltransferase involved in cell wall biosynthesis